MKILPEIRCKDVYVFIIREDVQYTCKLLQRDFENDWIRMDLLGDVTIKGSNGDGYTWDGCSPKVNVCDLFFLGTPDGRISTKTGKPCTYYASLIHDTLYQFIDEIGISRREADRVFLHYLGDFQLRYLYYFAVRMFGGVFLWRSKKKS